MGYAVSHGPVFKKTEYLFVDGGYLKKVLDKFSKEYFDGVKITIDWQKLKGDAEKIFFYDCLPLRGENEPEVDYNVRIAPNIELHKKIKMTPGYHVFEGALKGAAKKVRQKKIDVLLSVHMLMHAINKNMERCTLLAGDLDFHPAVEALIQFGAYVTLWYEESSASEELIYAADAQKRWELNYIFQYADQDFINRFERPNTGIGPNKEITDFASMKKEFDAFGNENELLRHISGSPYLLVKPREQTNNFFHISHPNLNFLIKYAAKVHGFVKFSV